MRIKVDNHITTREHAKRWGTEIEKLKETARRTETKRERENFYLPFLTFIWFTNGKLKMYTQNK